MVRGFALVALLGAVGVAPAVAQGGFSVTPWAGAYVPTRNSFSTVGSDIRRDNSFIAGARLTFWGHSPVGLEFTGGVASAPGHGFRTGKAINGDRQTAGFLRGGNRPLRPSPSS